MGSVAVSLPGGWFTEGGLQRTARLRALRGFDELFLAEETGSLIPAARVTALLTRVIESLGELRPVGREAVQALTAGDREALLLHLRRLTFGERLSCLVRCAQPACGEKLDLDLRVADLLAHAYADVQRHYEDILNADSTRYRVRYRLPNGADQEAVATIACEDAERAARTLLSRCIVEIEALDAPHAAPDPLPAALVDALAPVMAARDPQAEIELRLHCPACGASFTALFDTAQYLFRELTAGGADLYREVHQLAFHYHWSEKAILSLSGDKRRRYLGLLAESLGAAYA